MIDAAAMLAELYAEHGEPCTVAGSAVTAIFDTGYADALGVAGVEPSLRCKTADVPTVAAGVSVIRGGVTYTVRTVEPLPPDGAETRLVLERT